jgi:hypothetical protein
MSFSRVAVLGVFPLMVCLSAACGSTTESDNSSTTTGSGGKASTSTSTSGTGGKTTSTTTTTTATTASSSSGDGAQGNPSNTYPAPFPAPPQVQNFGGPVLSSPKFVPVFFSNDDAATVSQVEDFLSKIGAGSYWTAAVSEYGVGAGTSTASVSLTEAAPGTIDDSAIQTWLAGKLNGDDPAWPAADANTVYVLHYPAGSTITFSDPMSGTASSCQDFGGYHSNITLDANHGGMNVAYAVLPRCQAFGGGTVLDELTGSESHELIEASTDPYPMTDPAYADVDDGHIYWDLALGGGEVGDMCAQFSGVFTSFPPDLPYVVQRTWSNKAALAGNDPCVPALPGEVYFTAAPELDDVTLSIMGQTVTVKAVQIPVGQSKTIDLDLFSNASTNGPFSVHVDDGNVLMGGSPLLSFSVGNAPTIACPQGAPSGSVCVGGENGQKIPVTITVKSAGQYNAELFWVVSESPISQNENLWVGLVTN